jgi:hypothetical protein
VTAPLRDPETRPLSDRAIQDLSFIRRAMEGASSFTDVPGWGLVGIGVTAIGATFLADAQPTAGRWLLVWLLEAVIAGSVGAALIWHKASRRVGRVARAGAVDRAEASDTAPRPVFGAAARKFLLGFWPGIVAGALLTFALVDFTTVWTAAGAVPRVLPGLWLTLYGVAVLTAGAHSVRPVPIMGLGFMVLGAAALFIPMVPASVWLALGFGALHAATGVVIARRHGG